MKPSQVERPPAGESHNGIHCTKNIKWVQQLLGHKRLENTDLYTQLINFESDEWHVATAKNLEEEKKLIEAGFEFVRYSEKTKWLYTAKENKISSSIVQGSGSIVRSSIAASRAADPGSNPGRSTIHAFIHNPTLFSLKHIKSNHKSADKPTDLNSTFDGNVSVDAAYVGKGL